MTREVARNLDRAADVHLSMKAAKASSAAVRRRLDCAAMVRFNARNEMPEAVARANGRDYRVVMKSSCGGRRSRLESEANKASKQLFD